MKRLSFLVLALFIVAGSAQAQRRDDRRDGSLVLRDGRNIIRINVGDDKDDRDMLKRIARLERAVSDLQEKVYDLQSAPVREAGYICSVNVFSKGFISAKAPSRAEALANTMNQCSAIGGGIFCRSEEVKCESL